MSWASISTEAEKHQKQKIALVSPKQRGYEKIKILSEYQGPGAETSRYQTNQIRPNYFKSDQFRGPWSKFGRIMSQMLFGRFWLQNQDLGASAGAIDIVFRAGSVPMGPGVQKFEEKKLRFIPRRFLKGTPTINSHIPYKRLGPISSWLFTMKPISGSNFTNKSRVGAPTSANE